MSLPADADLHLFETPYGPHVLLVDGSRIFGVDLELRDELSRMLETGEGHISDLLREHGLLKRGYVDDRPLRDPPLKALSLAVAQKCNLGCSYCYAQEGTFGGAAKDMPWPVAEAAVRRLVEGAAPGERVNLSFLGGEPLTNRDLIRRATELAAAVAADRGVKVGFSITTNGTLLSESDAEFFEQHGFAVTISLDGVGETHDRLRPFRGGRPSYQRIVDNARSLLACGRRAQVSARVTVTPQNLSLRETLDGLLALGFSAVGFSPVLRSPTGRDTLSPDDLGRLLAAMIDCAGEFERRVMAGAPYGFSNVMSALDEIHRGTHRPYPCGAGAGYMGVSADGGLFACHRFVDDPAGSMGDVTVGVDRLRQRRWLAERHVHQQSPCGGCWARYLCGGGCHHEVLQRGRPACDFIRGWLDHCLGLYVRLSERTPSYFESVGKRT
jgi:uncharacterized protein